jgi:mono/diheme cytochrome c family protein
MRFKCLIIGTAVLTAVGAWQAQAVPGSGAKKGGGPDTADLLKHGNYLVKGAILCSDCHTPQDDQGKPDLARLLQGATLPIRPKKETKTWADESPDITGSGLAGQWSEKEMVKFLTTGIDPDGKKARPPMPAFRLNARDARAVALYLKSLPGSKKGGNRQTRSKDSE